MVGLASMSDVAERFLVYSPEIFRLMAARLVRSIGGMIHMSVRQCFLSGFRPSGMKRLAHCHREGAFFRMHVSLFACIMGDDFHGNKGWILETKKHVICTSEAN